MEAYNYIHNSTHMNIASVTDVDKLLLFVFGSSGYVIFNKTLVLKALKCLDA